MRKHLLQGLLLAAGGVLLAIGLYLEQYRSVWMKAIRICLECIGLG